MKDFHAYIAEKEFEFNSNDLKSKVKMLGDENLQLRETCQSLESAVELLNVRLLSLNNIIKIQETELSKDGIHIVDERSPKILSKWRDKVYSLLVQLKSHEILENEDMRNLKSKVCILVLMFYIALKYFLSQRCLLSKSRNQKNSVFNMLMLVSDLFLKLNNFCRQTTL